MTVAYEVLRDPERRARYDRFGPEGVFGAPGRRRMGGFGFEGGLGDIFEAFFGRMARRPAAAAAGRRPGPDAEVRLGLEFAEAVFGARKEISVRLPVACAARARARGAARAPTPVTCADCQGTGELRRVRQSLLGQVVTSVACSRCGGHGRDDPAPVPDCRGEGRRMRGQHVHRRGARRRRRRLDAAAGRARARPVSGAARAARSSSTSP